MLDSIYHMILILIKIAFWRENANIYHFLRSVIMDVIM